MRTLLKFTCLFSFLILISAQAVLPQEAQRGITPEDYFAFEFLSDPHISPDGKLVAYVVTKVDRAQNRRNSAIWMVAADGARAVAVHDQPAVGEFTVLESRWQDARVSFGQASRGGRAD
jgi:dipeptidyl aminopeptidase/acylaminoacyl peptidase